MLCSAATSAPSRATIAGSCDYLSGLPFAFVQNIDGVGAWPPVYESHVEMDGAWALFEGWLRLQLGDIDIALVIGSGMGGLSAAIAQQDTLFLWWNLLALLLVGVPVVWLLSVSLPVGDVRAPAAVLAGGVALCLLLWPLGVDDVGAAKNDLPWLWLILPTTMATLAALGSVRLSLLYGIGVGGLYGVIHTLDVGGDGNVPTAVLEAVLLLVAAGIAAVALAAQPASVAELAKVENAAG